MKEKCVNIACGDVYVQGWVNLDYAPHSSAVTHANLLDRLPLGDAEADLAYSSHFIEHIPRDLVRHFLSECFRILKPGAYLRLVLPDLEEMCRCYLARRESAEHDKADFLVLEMLDQCVRMRPGGELGDFYERLRTAQAPSEMIEFVRKRTGHEVHRVVGDMDARWVRVLRNPEHLLGRLQGLYCRLVLALLPSAFRKQNVSLASVGERHAWIYDFHSIERALKEAGFADIRRVSASTSSIDDFPFFPLDVTSEGLPRKGLESMYIEAAKP